MEKKNAFLAKNRQKIGFFGVFRSTLRHLGISPYPSDDGKSHSIATHLDAIGVPTKKQATLWGKNCVLGQKPSKNWVFWGIQVYTKTPRNFTVSFR